MSTQPPTNDPPKPSGQTDPSAETLAFVPPEDKEAVTQPGGSTTTPATVDSGTRVENVSRQSLIGQSFDDLEIMEEIGRGGMGVVFKARQKSLDRFVAVKLLLAEHFQDPARLARFHAEARASASLEHKNIIQVYQVGECTFGHYFSMEYIDGHSLESLLKKGLIPVPSSVALMIVLAEAIHYAHTKGVVHRDLKPANILVDRARRPVIMDFGIAKMVGKSSSLTQQGVIMGTPAYMAPEQAGESSDKVGPHSDVYALGAILYTMLTGQLPYNDENPLRIVLKVISPEMPPPVRSIQPEVPERLEHICMKCLSKKPADRYADAKTLANALRRFHAKLTHKTAESPMSKRRSVQTMKTKIPSAFMIATATGKQIRIPQGEAIVGRTSECDIVVKAADVSKQHCRLVVEADHVVVEDLDSANGTCVNDKPIKRAVLNDGDKLSIAEHEFVVRLPHTPE